MKYIHNLVKDSLNKVINAKISWIGAFGASSWGLDNLKAIRTNFNELLEE